MMHDGDDTDDDDEDEEKEAGEDENETKPDLEENEADGREDVIRNYDMPYDAEKLSHRTSKPATVMSSGSRLEPTSTTTSSTLRRSRR